MNTFNAEHEVGQQVKLGTVNAIVTAITFRTKGFYTLECSFFEGGKSLTVSVQPEELKLSEETGGIGFSKPTK